MFGSAVLGLAVFSHKRLLAAGMRATARVGNITPGRETLKVQTSDEEERQGRQERQRRPRKEGPITPIPKIGGNAGPSFQSSVSLSNDAWPSRESHYGNSRTYDARAIEAKQ